MALHRFLLDEHMKPFIGLPLDLFGFEIVELKHFDANLVNTATPDWIIYLAAAKSAFTGLITNDQGQLSQENEARALDQTGIAVVTYRKGVNDELTKWGLLMAYSPRIVAALDRGERGAIVLPKPGALTFRSPRSLLHNIEMRERVSAKELRNRADQAMKDQLAQRRKEDLWPT